jgi:hypothetical protein
MPPVRKKLSPARTSLRFEPPTLDETIFAAQGLAADAEGQTEIAAMLIGLPEAEVRAAILKAALTAGIPRQLPRMPQPGARRPVVVERRAPRVLMR